MNGSQNVIEVTNLTIGYDDRVVLHDLNFTIQANEIVCIMGDSGCGKSTLLKHMIGLYEPKSGDILINGKSIVRAGNREKNSIMRSFGVTYQGGALFGSLTVAENVELPLREYTGFSRQERMKIVEEKLSLVGLAGFGNFMPAELSGGMKKRAGLARALALNPNLLFFDEPSAGLDPLSSAELDKLILSLKSELGATVIVITHELDSVFTIADRSLMLSREYGTLIADGPPEELRKSCNIEWVRKFLNRGGMNRGKEA